MSVILSLDISASSTGWCLTEDGLFFEVGILKTSSKFSRAQRLSAFACQLRELLILYKPTHIVMEDTFSGKNVKTLKILSEFAGVTKYVCYDCCKIDPYVISTNTVKAFFKARKKETLFYFLIDILDKKDLPFAKNNDIIDAIAQLMCYAQHILKEYTFRLDKPYGFIYYSEDVNGRY